MSANAARRDGGDRIEVQVDSLELEGIAVAEPERVQSAFQGELTRLLTEEGLPERLAERPAGAEIDGGALGELDLESPERLGQAVARRVYAELSR